MRRRTIFGLVGAVGLTLAAVPLAAFAGESADANLSLVTPGGVFLANIDDDAGRCRPAARKITKDAVAREAANDARFQQAKDDLMKDYDQDPAGAEAKFVVLRQSHRLEQNLADRQMAACNDAADEVVNGAADEQDLARLRVTPWPGAPSSATGRISVTGNIRVFVKRARWEVATTLTAAELRTGVQLGVEGRDVVRDRTIWDGTAVVTLGVSANGKNTTHAVRMHAAPALTQLNTQKLERVLTAGPAWRQTVAAVLPKNVPLTSLKTGDDKWTQDLFEPLYQVMPGLDGRPHGMRVLLPSVSDLHRQAARVTYTDLKGPDVAVAHVPGVPAGVGTLDDSTYDSMGNLETMPPTPGHPHGTIVMGGTPSAEIVTFLRSQGAQDVVMVDTGFLAVGHLDEFVQFLPAAGGWQAIVADPQAGLDLLTKVTSAGQVLHPGLPDAGDSEFLLDKRTIAEFQADEQFVDTNRIAAAKITENLARLGLGPDRVVRIPMLFTARNLDWFMTQQAGDEVALNALRAASAEIPNLINGLVVSNTRYVAPKPYGPLLNGTDVFAAAFDKALGRLGYQVTYADDLLDEHLSEGEIHCATNTFRAYPA
ncbi:protein-arginine deiminase [Actinoplanes tereljensis]|uniref:Caspase family p20 domain-containing protein n=1 Tax=Paractinoplanes tereljensis TaxID=571912 RepID=A0A919NRT1_9ACTN|nr:protein-arginine deiminase family protein [Actinoplanes tereljensis]GIF23143.1 hypothetical protein Ate02nite_58730 [Actinoplanes tereljensis]